VGGRGEGEWGAGGGGFGEVGAAAFVGFLRGGGLRSMG
jgi:hypothetical protein